MVRTTAFTFVDIVSKGKRSLFKKSSAKTFKLESHKYRNPKLVCAESIIIQSIRNSEVRSQGPLTLGAVDIL